MIACRLIDWLPDVSCGRSISTRDRHCDPLCPCSTNRRAPLAIYLPSPPPPPPINRRRFPFTLFLFASSDSSQVCAVPPRAGRRCEPPLQFATYDGADSSSTCMHLDRSIAKCAGGTLWPLQTPIVTVTNNMACMHNSSTAEAGRFNLPAFRKNECILPVLMGVMIMHMKAVTLL